MSEINVDVDLLDSYKSRIFAIQDNIKNIKQKVDATRLEIDKEILYKEDINTRFQTITNKLGAMESRANKVNGYMGKTKDSYIACMQLVKKQSLEVEKAAKSIGARFTEALVDAVKSPGSNKNAKGLLTSSFFFGISFFFEKDSTGKCILKIRRGKFSDEVVLLELKKLFNGDIPKSVLDRLLNGEGVILRDNKNRVRLKNKNSIKRGGFPELDDAIDDVLDGKPIKSTKDFAKKFAKEFGKEMNFKEKFKDLNPKSWKKLPKAGKIGVKLDVLDVVSAVTGNLDEFKDAKDGVVDNTIDFAVGTSVDLAASAATTAIGSAIGTALVPIPPIGTIIGYGVGFLASAAINTEFGDPPKSVVDRTKDAANYAVDQCLDGVKSIGKGLANVFW